MSSRCVKHILTETPLCLEMYGIQGDIRRIDCKTCYSFLDMKLNGEAIRVNEVSNDRSTNNWQEVRTNRDKLIYYALSQIIYPEFDPPNSERFESLYDFAEESDRIFLRWENGKSIGFYTIKPKDARILFTGEKDAMIVVDTIFVRSEYRNGRFGHEILTDVVERFPNEDIGFSMPISTGMLKALKRFLTNHREHRLRFWQVADYDIETSQQLIWCRLRNQLL